MIEKLTDFVLQQVRDNQFFQGGALTAALFGIWQTVRQVGPWIYQRIKRLVIYEIVVDTTREYNSIAYNSMVLWVNTHAKNKMRRVRAFVTEQDLEYEQTSDYMWVWFRGLPILIAKERVEVQNAHSLSERYEDRYVIRGLKRSHMDLFVRSTFEAYRKYEKAKTGIMVHNCSEGFGGPTSRNLTTVKSFERLYFAGKEDLISDLDKFLASKDKYIRMGVAYKRGYLLTGPPGTGKSSCVLAMAAYTGWDVYTVSMADVKSDAGLINIMLNIPNNSIIAFEDVDVFFTQKRGKGETKVSFSAFLNCMDGAHAPTDAIIVMTTNHPDRLDYALLRKGRIDFEMEIGSPSSKDITDFLYDFYGERPTFEPKECRSMAEVQETALRSETLKDFEDKWTVM